MLMKLLLLMTSLSLFVASCDAPVRTRVPTSEDYASIPAQNFDQGGNTTGTNGTNGTNGTTNTTGNNGQTTSEQGYDHCPYLTPDLYGKDIGYLGLCQNSNDERQFKAIFAESDSTGTCFVPVSILSNGNSYKLGIAECVHNQADTNYYMTLRKEMMPPNYNYPRTEAINGVMVISYESVNAYMGCMNSKEQYYATTQGCCYNPVYNQAVGRWTCTNPNPYCETAATNFANNICNLFVQNHSNKYIQVNF